MPSDGARILVVSDDSSVRDEASFAFPSSIEVRLATDGREARGILEEWTPSAVLVDLQTGNEGGFGLARDMHSDSRWSAVPIVILLERDQDKWLANQAGAKLVRVKPIDVGRLVDETLALID